ncbi:uncharacterized protein SAPINGB_P002191 [Magnusiomyces paraingens]|uniref:amidase n=1 Tax=Magnusiomyces paraingens TaxID=2606893 RepID=A0A5E8BKK8_9ASCO|nr:uncharacterized protein SAPINGB_P002191 [Saprochaete ingens]VVT49276.1 unnamed protein product [Saprochaete ingens]
MVFEYFKHRRDINLKRNERADKISTLEKEGFGEPLTAQERAAINLYTEDAVAQIKSGALDASVLFRAYSKRALQAQHDTNCLTELLIDPGYAEAKALDPTTEENKSKPLLGFPVSVKDTHNIKGYDSTIGYTANAFHPATKDAPIIRMLRDAGAIPFVKTNVPYTMLSFECYNDLWGYTDNPHVAGYAPGGSTGGEACLLAYGGSRIGVGTDVAGSVRVPAHFSGCYSLKCSTGRFPKVGNTTSMSGQEGIPAVYSPMTRTLPDLGYFLKSVISMKPWEYDYTVHPMPWDNSVEQALKDKAKNTPKEVKVGVIYDDGVVTPSPACRRALDLTLDALKAQGYTISEFDAPEPLQALRIASQLLVSDAGKVALRKQRCGEHNDAGVDRFMKGARLPRFVKKIWAWFLENIWGDHVWATLVRDWNEKTIVERWDLVAEREGYKAAFFDKWSESEIDFLITVPNATPSFPHRGLLESYASCGYTFMFNLLDYAAGILPVTKVDKEKDALPKDFKINKLNRVARGAYVNYNAEKMHGLPVGIQVVAPRLREETCLAAMDLVSDALQANGTTYELLNA